jgi:hypothetical protein
LVPIFLQGSVKLAKIFRALPVQSEPNGNRFFLPIAKGFTGLSAMLLSTAQPRFVAYSTYPSGEKLCWTPKTGQVP